ncbi:MAG: SPASM domain-containing protein [Bacteroidetes bacterium]|nr:SPASM domain-containing protein [Bacteroidota bacterium]
MNRTPYEKIDVFQKEMFRPLTRLKDVIPLETPYSIVVDPSNLCNFRCAFCPTGDSGLLKKIGRPKGNMPLSLFQKIIDDISGFRDSLKALWLVKDGEPLMNPDFGRMIRYAKESGIADVIKTTTNASLLDGERGIELIESGLDHVRISVEQITDDGYRRVTRNYSDYGRIRRNVTMLFNEKIKRRSRLTVHVKILDIDLTDTEKEKFIHDFKDISDSLNIETLMGWSRSEVKDFTLGKAVEYGMSSAVPLKRDRKICPEPFKTLSVNFNGAVSVCCVDWSFGTVVGDVTKEKIGDIWNGPRLHEFRMKHLQGDRRTISSCANCQYLQGIPAESDIDDFAESVRETLKCRNS